MQSAPREPVPSGTHLGICYRVMNLGTRLQEYMGTMKDHPDTLITLTFELPNEKKKFTVKSDDGTEQEVEKPLVISREFVLSMGPKSNLRPFVEGIIGVKLTDEEAYAFNLEDLLGRPCLVNVIHKVSPKNGNTYANITTTSPLMKGMEVPKQYNKNNIFDVNEVEQDEIFALPQFIQDKIIVSDEYKKRFVSTESLGGVDNPF